MILITYITNTPYYLPLILSLPLIQLFDPRLQHSIVEISHEIISTAILSLPLIQVGQLSVGEYKRNYTKFSATDAYFCI